MNGMLLPRDFWSISTMVSYGKPWSAVALTATLDTNECQILFIKCHEYNF